VQCQCVPLCHSVLTLWHRVTVAACHCVTVSLYPCTEPWWGDTARWSARRAGSRQQFPVVHPEAGFTRGVETAPRENMCSHRMIAGLELGL